MIGGFQVGPFQTNFQQGVFVAPVVRGGGGDKKKRRLYVPASKSFDRVLDGTDSELVELEARTEALAWVESEKSVSIKSGKKLEEQEEPAILLALLS